MSVKPTEESPAQLEELGGSELGTKSYWDSSYDAELSNYRSHGDVGEVWFDEDSQFRVIRWMEQSEIAHDAKIIDLGCGNGMMLIEMAREGFHQLHGMDYSHNAIQLAEQIARDQELSKSISYKQGDLLSDAMPDEFGTFDVVHDKGTYDAISLHPDDPRAKREQYVRNVHRLLAGDQSLLIITSCNWTESELCSAFAGKFERVAAIPAPMFRFGGQEGSVVTSLVFRKL